jgi:hypothetical protein
MPRFFEITGVLFLFGWISLLLLTAHDKALHTENAGNLNSFTNKWLSKYLVAYVFVCGVGASVINNFFQECSN